MRGADWEREGGRPIRREEGRTEWVETLESGDETRVLCSPDGLSVPAESGEDDGVGGDKWFDPIHSEHEGNRP